MHSSKNGVQAASFKRRRFICRQAFSAACWNSHANAAILSTTRTAHPAYRQKSEKN